MKRDRASEPSRARDQKNISVAKLTPMMQQYLQIKQEHPDAILFYRMGDFYEMFFDDAKIASTILDIALTSRDRDKEGGVPMCGVPYHAASSYIAKLIQRGHKVAICEQVEDPQKAKGLVRREVVRVVTPGLVLDPDSLVSDENNFVLALFADTAGYGLSFLDISTGEFSVTELQDERSLLAEVERIDPREILFPQTLHDGSPELIRKLSALSRAVQNPRPVDEFHPARCQRMLCKHFGVSSLEGFGCKGMSAGIRAAGAVLRYAKETQGEELPHIRRLKPYHLHEHMVLDDWTRRNLELFESLQDRSRKGTLISCLDRTLTPMGGRLIRKWLSYPLLDPQTINQRLDAVEELVQEEPIREGIRDFLNGIQDLERLASRVILDTANARDLVGLKNSLTNLPGIRGILEKTSSHLLRGLLQDLDPLEDVAGWIHETLVDDPPVGLKEGGLIREGFDQRLDEWIRISREGKTYIARLEAEERERTGISTLKVGYNRVFGYYIEVTKAHTHAVPADYVRKQTLVNAERYINEKLKAYELKVSNAEEHRIALEYELFQDLRRRVAGEGERIQRTAEALGQLDVLTSLALVAVEYRYIRPKVDEGNVIQIQDGRHPVVERMELGERFVPNDLALDPEETQMIILTGPNMAGKSTFLRQVALIVLMAQMGSFVPASEAHIGVVDRIFTRVGAMDNLAKGQSTFMVEMSETAQILHNATSRSLIILDEIGRGTSTFDGLSIAWAVAEFILDHPRIGAKTLFATHYHELTELACTHPKVKNYHIAVREWNDQIIFLRKVVEGATSRSYGIQVARLAGLPEKVVRRAQEILFNLERGEFNEVGEPRLARSPRHRRESPSADPRQLSLFGEGGGGWLMENLRSLDLDTLTPLEALNLLYRWKERIGRPQGTGSGGASKRTSPPASRQQEGPRAPGFYPSSQGNSAGEGRGKILSQWPRSREDSKRT